MQRIKRWVGVAMAFSIIAVAGCSAAGSGGSPEETAGAEQSQTGAPQDGKPNTDSIPEVVAEVNGEKITKDDFVPLFETQYQQMMMQAQQAGQPVDEEGLKKQTAENLVSTKLLSQEADKRGIKASDDDVTKALDEAAASSQMSTEDFLAAMKDQGMDEKKVHEELGTQLKIEDLIVDEFGEFEVTDEEIGAAYQRAKDQQEQMAAQSGQEAPVPSLEEMRPQLEEQVKGEKSTEATQKFAGDLREKGDVTINL